MNESAIYIAYKTTGLAALVAGGVLTVFGLLLWFLNDSGEPAQLAGMIVTPFGVATAAAAAMLLTAAIKPDPTV